MQTIYRIINGFGVGLALWGLVVLVLGYISLSRKGCVRGFRARLLALVAILPLPIAFLMGYLWASAVACFGWQFSMEETAFQGVFFEGCLLALSLSTIYFYYSRWAQPVSVKGDSRQIRSLPESPGEFPEEPSGIG